MKTSGLHVTVVVAEVAATNNIYNVCLITLTPFGHTEPG